ncbi:MAG: TolC family protein [Prevotella sp.]|nr:TolC family protein [Prevotella sp.]
MKKIVYTLGVTLLLNSCGIYQNYTEDRQQKVIAQQVIREENMEAMPVLANESDSADLLSWQQFYSKPQLQELIREALAHNSNLAIAHLNITQAMASLGQARGLLYPSVGLDVNGSMSSYDNSKVQPTYSAGLTASWQIDIFNKLGNDKRATAATVEERQAYAQAVRTQLIGSVAQSYYMLEILDAKIKVVEQTVGCWEDQINAQKAMMKAGQADQAAIAQAEASRLSAEASLAQLRKQVTETENTLCSLLGHPSGKIARGQFSADDFTADKQQGFSIQHLATRPDIRQAEASLKAAFYRTNAARAAFYPSLRLTGSAGWTNNGGGIVTNPGALLLQAAASLAQPLINNSQNKANLAIAKAQQQQALLSFRQKVLDAGIEVNNALAAYQTARNVVGLQERQVAKLGETLRTTQLQMDYGTTNYLQVLIARQSLLAAQMDMLTNSYEQVVGYITLYGAFGGGIY